MSNPEETEEFKLRDQIQALRMRFDEAKSSADRAAMDQIIAAVRPLQRRLRELQAHGLYAKICPITWTHRADEKAIEDAIANPVLRRFAGEPDAETRSALLLGPSKVGKSTTLGLALRRALWRGRLPFGSVVWAYARALSQASRQYPLGEGVCPEIERATKAKLLILDDLGLERDPAELVDVVHARYEAERVTWTTAGLTLQELRDRYGEAFVRRLSEGRAEPGRVVAVFPKAVAAAGGGR